MRDSEILCCFAIYFPSMNGRKYQREPSVYTAYTPILKRWVIIFLVWTVIALLFASQAFLELAYVQDSARQLETPFLGVAKPSLFLPILLRWYVWAMLTPSIFKLAEKFPMERPFLWRRLFSVIGVSIVITLVVLTIMSLIQNWFGSDIPPLGLEISFPPHFLIFWAIFGVGHLLHYQQQNRERDIQTAQLEARLAQAQLQVLRSQLNPHFLFNTLHAISAMMPRDVEAADQMLARLSELLRLSLEEIAGQFSTLQAEFHFLKLYLEIEQVRFQDRLLVSVTAPAELLSAQVPTMLLQPLVENAVRYAIAPRMEPGQINVSALRSNGQLCLEVADDGAGLPHNFTPGLGLTNIQSRLQQLYPNNHQFELDNRAGGGLLVRIALPFNPHEEGEPID